MEWRFLANRDFKRARKETRRAEGARRKRSAKFFRAGEKSREERKRLTGGLRKRNSFALFI